MSEKKNGTGIEAFNMSLALQGKTKTRKKPDGGYTT